MPKALLHSRARAPPPACSSPTGTACRFLQPARLSKAVPEVPRLPESTATAWLRGWQGAGREQAAGSTTACSQQSPQNPEPPPYLVALPLRQVPQAPQLHEHLVMGGADPRGGACSGATSTLKPPAAPSPVWVVLAAFWGDRRGILGVTHPAGSSPHTRSRSGERPATCPRHGTSSGRSAPRGCSHPAHSAPGSPCRFGHGWVPRVGGATSTCPAQRHPPGEGCGAGVSSPAHGLHHGTLLVEAGHPQHLSGTAPAQAQGV